MQQPSIGRIVHFYDGEVGPSAAIVTAVHSDDCVSLCVFPFGGATAAVVQTSVLYREAPTGPRWIWPPRV